MVKAFCFILSQRAIDAEMRGLSRAFGMRSLIQPIDNEVALALMIPVTFGASISSYFGTGWWVDIEKGEPPKTNPLFARLMDAGLQGFFSRASALMAMLIMLGGEISPEIYLPIGLLTSGAAFVRTNKWEPNKHVWLHDCARICDAFFRGIARGMSASSILKVLVSDIKEMEYIAAFAVTPIATFTSYRVTAWWDRRTVENQEALQQKLKPHPVFSMSDSCLRGIARASTFLSIMKIFVELFSMDATITWHRLSLFVGTCALILGSLLLSAMTSQSSIRARIDTTLFRAASEGRIDKAIKEDSPLLPRFSGQIQ